MAQASYILTYRQGEGTARRDNLLAVLTWLARYPDFEVIVVEQDDAPRLEGPLPHPQCRHVFAYNPGPFNKGWGFNVGVRHARFNAYAFGDADVITGDVVIDAIHYLAQGYQAVKPYRRLVDLDEAQSARVRAGEFDWQPAPESQALNREGIGEFLVFAGGLFLMTRTGFARVGGWDERFLGWGGEDDAMSYKIERSRMPALELDARTAVHLYHPRPPESTSGQAHYASNLAVLDDYLRLSDEELMRLSEIHLQISGQREKYRPQ